MDDAITYCRGEEMSHFLAGISAITEVNRDGN